MSKIIRIFLNFFSLKNNNRLGAHFLLRWFSYNFNLKKLLCQPKKNLLNANHLFVWHKMFATAAIVKYIFGRAQKNWTSTIHFRTCKMTRHYSNSIKYRFSGLQVQKLVKKIFKKLSRIAFKVHVSNHGLSATFELGFFNFSWAKILYIFEILLCPHEKVA